MNEEEVSSFSLKSYREKIVSLTQESYLFEMTLYENILFGAKRTVSEEEVYQAAKSAGAHDFIMKLPRGYQTVYGENDSNLSQGQKQRMSLARVFLREADVIILDEPTANLDPESTRRIFKNLQVRYGEQKIIIVISHDEGSLKDLNKVYHLTDGKLVLER